MSSVSAAKYLQVRDELARAIRAGEFSYGQRLPAERELAKNFGVSHMTARQAVTELVEAELVERRLGSGIYVRQHSQRRLSTQTINVICQEYENSLSSGFLRATVRAINARGWDANIVRLHPAQERVAIKMLGGQDPSLVFVQEPSLHDRFGEALRKHAGRAVLVGNRLDQDGIPSVLCDGLNAMQLLVDNLKKHGHRNMAIVSDHPGEFIDKSMLADWQHCLGDTAPADLQSRVIAVNTPRYECPGQYAYAAVRQFLETRPAEVSALICLNDEVALASLKACRDLGLPVGEKMSMVCTIDSMLMEFSHPPVTSIDVDMPSHLENAMELVDKILAENLETADLLRIGQPQLIERKSVCHLLS